ncbi:hypothetical protein EV426DRAFT_672249 [Tirmania nivea]|nr:hypothetical protein EV426DRAFT_672249 [Tirmania nivea]
MFQNISYEIHSLHILIDMHKDIFQDRALSSDEKTGLRGILERCTSVLQDLDKSRNKYMSLDSAQDSGSQAIDRKSSQENIAELRARLTSNTTLLDVFIHCKLYMRGSEKLTSCSPSQKFKLRLIIAFGCLICPKGLESQQILFKIEKTKLSSFSNTQMHPWRSTKGPKLQVPWFKMMPYWKNNRKANEEIEATRSDIGSTPLDTAAQNGHTDAVQLLVEKGANIEPPEDSLEQHRLIHIIHWTYRRGSAAIGKGANIEATRTTTRVTPLETAVYFGHTDVTLFGFSWKRGEILSPFEYHWSNTARYYGIFGYTDMVRMLLEKGANIEAIRSDDGSTALNSAS